jgi:ADP-ribosyl-[dinitrogen reductase] hydrolase
MVDDHSPLVGCAVADALGMPFETKPANDPMLLNWDGSYLPSEYHKLNPGQWTDDTMMSKMLMESLYICGGFYPRDVANRYLHWYLAGDTRGMGKTTRAALQRLKEGYRWTDSGLDHAEGNGTAMRSAPMGAFYHEDPLTVAEFARIESRITHKSIEASEGSAAVALMVAYIWQGVEKGSLIKSILGYLNQSKIKSKLTHLDQQKDSLTLAEAFNTFGTLSRVTQTVPSAFAAFLLTNSYEEAVMAAIRAGGDTDTTASIAGSIAGSYYGFGAIPNKFKLPLERMDHLHKLDSHIGVGPNTSVMWKL